MQQGGVLMKACYFIGLSIRVLGCFCEGCVVELNTHTVPQNHIKKYGTIALGLYFGAEHASHPY